MRIVTAAAIVLCAATLACDSGKPRRTASSTASHEMIGLIDVPAAGSTVAPVFLVSGWTLGRAGIERVRIYLDDELLGTALVDIPRPDVDLQFPRYASTGPRHGFATTIDAGSRSGFRTLRIEAIDKTGAKAHVASHSVKIVP
jgi:hypothetical protein